MEDSEEVESVLSPNGLRSKHVWTVEEDKVLVDSLYALHLMGGWKVDTGFRAGYQMKVEAMILAKLPNCGIKGKPHVEGRVKTLKRQAFAIADMFVSGSGFAWDEDNKKVTCEKQIFDDWAKSHPSAKGLFNRPFPHHDTILEIFGKDRANGKGATTLAAEEEEIEATEGNDAENSVPVDLMDGMDISSNQALAANSEPPRKRSRKNSEGSSEVSAAINRLVDVTGNYLEKIGNAVSVENVTSTTVANELEKIEGLTFTELMEVGKHILHDNYMSTLFLNRSNEKRLEMVKELLKK